MALRFSLHIVCHTGSANCLKKALYSSRTKKTEIFEEFATEPILCKVRRLCGFWHIVAAFRIWCRENLKTSGAILSAKLAGQHLIFRLSGLLHVCGIVCTFHWRCYLLLCQQPFEVECRIALFEARPVPALVSFAASGCKKRAITEQQTRRWTNPSGSEPRSRWHGQCSPPPV